MKACAINLLLSYGYVVLKQWVVFAVLCVAECCW